MPPLWQGVTQQDPQFHKPGQVPNLVNMLCDPVTGLRRRPGIRSTSDHVPTGGFTNDSLFHQVVEVSGTQVVVGVNTHTGQLFLCNPTNGNVITQWGVNDYFKASSRYYIQTAIVGDRLYVANLEKKPTVERDTTTQALRESGFAYVSSGAFGKTFQLQVSFAGPSAGRSVWAEYKTPDGSQPGDAEKATPEYIAHQLVTNLRNIVINSGPWNGKKVSEMIHIANEGGYIAFRANRGAGTDQITSVTSTTGATWIVTSGTGHVLNSGMLPGVNHWLMNSAVFRVGSGDSAPYFRWDENRKAWLETAAPNSIAKINNTPVAVWWDGTRWYHNAPSFFPGRQAGDDNSNPEFAWMTQGISGIFGYQGRLGILSGSKVALSASGKPNVWFRTTVTELLDSDPIEVATSSQSAATYTQAIQYRKDVLLFSSQHQAYMPGANRVLTPRTATVQGIDQYGSNSRVAPQVVGPTLMFCRDLPGGYTGVMEINPATQVEGEYQIFDSTPHLPRYFNGKARFFRASANAPMAVLATDSDYTELYVYEYAFDGQERMQSAWHKWVFKHTIVDAFWVGPTLFLVQAEGNRLFYGTIDPRGDTAAFHLDHWKQVRWDGRWWVIDNTSAPSSPSGDQVYFYAKPTDPMYGSAIIGQPAVGTVAAAGFTFTSRVTLPEVTVTGSDGRPVPLRDSTVLRYDIGLNDAYDTWAFINYGQWGHRREDPPPRHVVLKPRRFTNGRLQLGRSWVVPRAYCQLIVRAKANDHYVTLDAVSGYRMNITGVTYALQYTPLYPRRQ